MYIYRGNFRKSASRTQLVHRRVNGRAHVQGSKQRESFSRCKNFIGVRGWWGVHFLSIFDGVRLKFQTHWSHRWRLRHAWPAGPIKYWSNTTLYRHYSNTSRCRQSNVFYLLKLLPCFCTGFSVQHRSLHATRASQIFPVRFPERYLWYLYIVVSMLNTYILLP